MRLMGEWRVCKRAGVWRVYDRGVWADSFDSLRDAHSWALAASVADVLFKPGGLSYLGEILDAADWWAAYCKACEGAE